MSDSVNGSDGSLTGFGLTPVWCQKHSLYRTSQPAGFGFSSPPGRSGSQNKGLKVSPEKQPKYSTLNID